MRTFTTILTKQIGCSVRSADVFWLCMGWILMACPFGNMMPLAKGRLTCDKSVHPRKIGYREGRKFGCQEPWRKIEKCPHALTHRYTGRYDVGQKVQLDILPVVRDEHEEREEENGADYVELKRNKKRVT